MRLNLLFFVLLIASICSPRPLPAQVYDSPDAAKANADFLVQGEYASDNKAMQVIARGDGDFEIVVYELGLPGAGWNKTPARRVDGDADVVAELAESMGLSRVERQSPTLGLAPPPDAIVLFDGTEQSLREHWNQGAKQTDDGLLIQGATSKDTFTDYRLHLEFLLPFMPKASGQGRGNSGVYHQGRYETQILDSFGLAGKSNETGGIYEVHDPDLNMCFPPLVWQTYDVEFTAARFDSAGKKLSPAKISASVNGVQVQTAIEVPNPTRAAPQQESAEPGPIHLQDHGNPVRFKNIWVVPRDVAKESRRPIVAGYERLFADNDPQLLGGKILIDTLGCQACHRGAGVTARNGKPLENNRSDDMQGPVLDNVADRVRADHLVRFIAAPRDVKPGTIMPDPWQGQPVETRQSSAVAIANYLLAGKPAMIDQTSNSAAVVRGKSLYHSRGCAVCHGPQERASQQDFVPLGELATKYTLGSLSGFLLDPVAARPCGRMPKVVANAIEARDIASFLLRDVVIVAGAEVIRRRVYMGNWTKLPDFSKLKPSLDSQVNELKIDDIKGQFAILFDGFIQLTESGRYTFRLSNDDGARFLLKDEVMIEADGIHPASEQTKRIKLEAGIYPFQIQYFEGGGQRQLTLEVESEAMGRMPLASIVSVSVGGAAKSLLPTTFRPDPALIKQGEKLFVTAGCANCHAKQSVAAVVRAKPLRECREDFGCLADEPPGGLPQFELTSRQRLRIAAAMRSIDELSANIAADPSQTIHHQMAAMNCYACHVRNDIGGPDGSTNPLFITTTPEMGDEGRLPPNLSGVGDKLNDEYLRSILANGADERPYMETRMPGFGKAIPASFITALTSLDRRDEGHDGKSIATSDADLIAYGRMLCGNEGLSCIKCHTFGGIGLPGIQAIDMLRMPERLRRDWFERYLLDPQAYRPGTRMPASFTNGKSVLTKIAEGRPADQIEAMWRFLSLDKDAKTPSGLFVEAIELKPAERPIIYRNFFSDVSPRGIAVGYPEAVNVIWDAQRMSLSRAWKNSFMDASKHWTGRGNGTQEPLGDAVVKLDRETPVAFLRDSASPWPKDLATSDAYRFQGYSLDKAGRPTFRYQCGAAIVEDEIQPMANDSSATTANRTFRLTGSGDVAVLVAMGKIQSEADGWYRVDDIYRVRVARGPSRLLEFGDHAELRIESKLEPTETVSFIVQMAW